MGAYQNPRGGPFPGHIPPPPDIISHGVWRIDVHILVVIWSCPPSLLFVMIYALVLWSCRMASANAADRILLSARERQGQWDSPTPRLGPQQVRMCNASNGHHVRVKRFTDVVHSSWAACVSMRSTLGWMCGCALRLARRLLATVGHRFLGMRWWLAVARCSGDLSSRHLRLGQRQWRANT